MRLNALDAIARCGPSCLGGGGGGGGTDVLEASWVHDVAPTITICSTCLCDSSAAIGPELRCRYRKSKSQREIASKIASKHHL